jgi:hypothetical protein
MKIAVLILAILISTIILQANTITVDTAGTADFNNIQAAIDSAVDGDVVLLADGTYTGSGNRDINFDKKIKVCSANGANYCIIDCQYLGRGFIFGSYCDSNSILDGVTVTHGEIYFPPGGPWTTKYGGAIYIWSSATITHCRIINNYADFGGGIYCMIGTPDISNCVIAQNTGFESGGGLYSLSANINNCTVADNSAGNSTAFGGGLYFFSFPKIRNSIIWNNYPDQVYMPPSPPPNTILSSVVGGLLNPQFADTANGDYHLKSQYGRWDPQSMTWVKDTVTSFCIDAGSGDWSNELWPNGKRCNIGAYGNTPEASMSKSTIGNIANLNGDDNDTVDLIDLSILLDKWCSTGILMKEDLNRDGRVDFTDLAVFAQQW